MLVLYLRFKPLLESLVGNRNTSVLTCLCTFSVNSSERLNNLNKLIGGQPWFGFEDGICGEAPVFYFMKTPTL